jgi:hypothetical protein
MIYGKDDLNGIDYLQVAKNYYVHRDTWYLLSNKERHLSLCDGISKRRQNLMFTAQSGCAIRGIARIDSYDLSPHCINISRRSSDVIRWHCGLPDPNATIVQDMLVASPMRIICDLALYDTPDSVLVSINHCLHNGLFTHKQFDEMIQEQRGMKGRKLLMRLSSFATEKCESPLETLAMLAIYKAGFVMPEQQKRIKLGGQHIARVDMYWEFKGKRIVLELDGKSKYKEKDDLTKEKEREDALRRLDYKVIRKVWKDVMNEDLVQTLTECGIPSRRNFGKLYP